MNICYFLFCLIVLLRAPLIVDTGFSVRINLGNFLYLQGCHQNRVEITNIMYPERVTKKKRKHSGTHHVGCKNVRTEKFELWILLLILVTSEAWKGITYKTILAFISK